MQTQDEPSPTSEKINFDDVASTLCYLIQVCVSQIAMHLKLIRYSTLIIFR